MGMEEGNIILRTVCKNYWICSRLIKHVYKGKTELFNIKYTYSNHVFLFKIE